jgi:hypothetical protein
MAKKTDRPASATKADKTGALATFLADENDHDRQSLLRIGAWGVFAIAAVVLAVISNQSSLGWRRDQIAAIDLARQTQQIQSLARESQNETKRLANAIDTLNTDRDRLYSRVTVLEQGLDSVTGSIAKQIPTSGPMTAALSYAPAPSPEPSPAPTAAASPVPTQPPQAKAQPAPQPSSPPQPPSVAPAASAPSPAPEKARAEAAAKPDQTPAPAPAQFASNASALAGATSQPPPLVPPKSMMGPPDPAASKLIETPKPVATAASPAAPAPPQAVASATPSTAAKDTPAKDTKDQAAAEAPPAAAVDTSVHHTDFAVDLGSANSVGGLRALWRGLVKSNSDLAELHPIIMVKESTTGLGMQLHLAAGPLHDAAAAARICVSLQETRRACETTLFDGQRLAMAADEAQPGEKPASESRPSSGTYKRGYYYSKRGKKEDTAPPSKPETTSTLSSLLGMGKH